MKKIEDGTYRAIRSDASGYVYGNYAYKKDFGNPHCIKEDGQDNLNFVTPIKVDTLMYRRDGKWEKV